MNRLSYITWATLALFIFASGGVVYFGWTISSDEVTRMAYIESAQQSSLKGASAARARALAQDTVKQRAELGELLAVDVVSIANMLEAVGKAAKVDMKLGTAQPENSPSGDATAKIHAVGFVVQADGKFSSLVRTAQLFETLPIPSSIRRLDLERIPSSSGPSTSWHMNLYIRILTTADISS